MRWVTVSALGPMPPRAEKGEDPERALRRMMDHWKAQIGQVLPDRPDLIALPEACDRYEEHDGEERAAYYRNRGERMLAFFAETARENRCHIAYCAARELPDGTWRNSTRILDRTGAVAGTYDKNFLVREEATEHGMVCGRDSPAIECDFGRLSCAICFDLNYDGILERTRRNAPDLIVFSSMYHGGLMQAYWAYRCRSYFIGAVARGLPCAVLDPMGRAVAQGTNYFHRVTARINLDRCMAHLDYNRERLEALKAAYGRGVSISDPGYLGSVLIGSETEGLSAVEMAREFGIELLDDYFRRIVEWRGPDSPPG